MQKGLWAKIHKQANKHYEEQKQAALKMVWVEYLHAAIPAPDHCL